VRLVFGGTPVCVHRTHKQPIEQLLSHILFLINHTSIHLPVLPLKTSETKVGSSFGLFTTSKAARGVLYNAFVRYLTVDRTSCSPKDLVDVRKPCPARNSGLANPGTSCRTNYLGRQWRAISQQRVIVSERSMGVV
jgi:hypothetical protein